MDQHDTLQDYVRMYEGLGNTVKDEIKEASKILLNLNENAHERLLRLATQISILFLTGWVYLLGSGNLMNPILHKRCIGFACFLHISTLGLVTWAQWRLMRAYDKRAEDLGESRKLIGTGVIEVQRWLIENPDMLLPSAVDKVKVDKLGPFFKNEEKSEKEFRDRNKITLWIGRAAIAVLFVSLVISLYLMIRFVGQAAH